MWISFGGLVHWFELKGGVYFHEWRQDLHWLPVRARCIFKLAVFAYKHFDGTLPEYLSDTIEVHRPSRILRSSTDSLLNVPKCSLKHYGERSFSFMAPKIWNVLCVDNNATDKLTLLIKTLGRVISLVMNHSYCGIFHSY